MNYTASMSVTCDTVDLHTRAMRVMTGVACDLAAHFSNMNVHAYSTDIDEGELTEDSSGEYFDDRTMLHVMKALTDGGVTVEYAQTLINEMLNAGILFRERSQP